MYVLYSIYSQSVVCTRTVEKTTKPSGAATSTRSMADQSPESYVRDASHAGQYAERARATFPRWRRGRTSSDSDSDAATDDERKT